GRTCCPWSMKNSEELQRTERPMKQCPDELLPLVYDELRKLAASRMTDESAGHTLQPTALVHEAWLRLVGAEDHPRPVIVHEGIPGHYFQLCLSWKHEDPIRRYYYDSGANEGIGFYTEEMQLQAGLFDDSPHTP